MNNPSDFFYFTNSNCQVCHVLLPKIEALVTEDFPEYNFQVVKVHENPEFAAANMVFAVPTIVVKSGDIEIYRRSGVFSLMEVEDQLNRIRILST